MPFAKTPQYEGLHSSYPPSPQQKQCYQHCSIAIRYTLSCGQSTCRHHIMECIWIKTDSAQFAHAALALFLLLQQLALPCDVATIALGQHIFPGCTDRLSNQDLIIHYALNCNLHHQPQRMD